MYTVVVSNKLYKINQPYDSEKKVNRIFFRALQSTKKIGCRILSTVKAHNKIDFKNYK